MRQALKDKNARLRLQVDASGGIIGAKIMDGGSAYAVGDSLQVVGVGTTSGYSVGIGEVTKIHDNSGDVIQLFNAKPEDNNSYNTSIQNNLGYRYRIFQRSTSSIRRNC